MDKSVYKRQFEENKDHWWFESRKKIVQNILKKNIKKKKIKILDFGCGVGINLEMLSKFGDLTAYDDNKIVLKFIRKKFLNRKIRFTNTINDKKKYDLIVAMDVIEHINDDKKIVEKLNKKLLKNGKILITVPAYNFLFTTEDIVRKAF
jgi:2-polyprenyl-3-methyl-5-hydroxy-6-metoxy-1,4-benzoquinol methylase